MTNPISEERELEENPGVVKPFRFKPKRNFKLLIKNLNKDKAKHSPYIHNFKVHE